VSSACEIAVISCADTERRRRHGRARVECCRTSVQRLRFSKPSGLEFVEFLQQDSGAWDETWDENLGGYQIGYSAPNNRAKNQRRRRTSPGARKMRDETD